MAKNWAIAIGINQYEFLQPLRYAKRDAEAIRAFLTDQAGFDRVFFFTDDSPAVGGKSTKPFGSNIFRVLRQVFKKPFMGDGDNFWFFFSGHGIRHQERDYLMPMDGDPEDVERTGIPTTYVTEQLRRCGADNVVMILDACRSEGRKSGVGIGQETGDEARQTGVISLFSCSPDQYSYELEALQQGAFTTALLEGLGIRGRCATVERLNQYLEQRVPELVNRHIKRASQVPYAIAEPLSRSHLILMPQYASLADIAVLKNDASRAERRQDWALAQRLWIRVLAAASGQDMDAIEALQKLALQQKKGTRVPNRFVLHDTSESSPIFKGKNIDKKIYENQKMEVLKTWIQHETISLFSRLTIRNHKVLSALFVLILGGITAILLNPNLIREAPSNPEIDLGNAITEVQNMISQGNLDTARALLEKVPKEDIDNPEVAFQQGRLIWELLKTGDTDFDLEDARRYWEHAAQTAGDKPQYYNALGFVLYAEGQMAHAVEAWLKALEILDSQGFAVELDSTNQEGESITMPTETISNLDVLTAHAGMALAFIHLAGESSTPRDLISEVGHIQQVIRNSSNAAEFEPDRLAQNWLWTESAIKEWELLSQLQIQ